MRRIFIILMLLQGVCSADQGAIVCVEKTPLMNLACNEVHRYVYLRTGCLLPIVKEPPETGNLIVLVLNPDLDDQEYQLKTKGRTLTITGGSEVSVLYGAYRYAEHLGVRFYLHGDLIPDKPVKEYLLSLDETRKPLFNLRGIQPFHDFCEGPDWWDLDDYKAVLSQLPKLGMNFFGLHCYPEGPVGPEPTIWIGLKEDVRENGEVSFSYPSRYACTQGGAWGYAPRKTSEFAAGASLLFESEDYGPEITQGHRPKPTSPEGCNQVFNRAGAFYRSAFEYARGLGIKVCVGTETPLTIPKEVIKARGLDPEDPDTMRRVYEGIFHRIKKAYPIDYYWLWTPETWTWGHVSDAQVKGVIKDMSLAQEALKNVEAPFSFATCGWVLGPPLDRSGFDRLLPKDAPIGCINRYVGFSPLAPGFSQIKDRPQWAIPWLEDDPAMIIPQLWVGRMRRDAADALAYGCTGLMGIHWRTRVVGPMVSALASAAWDQTPWNTELGKKIDLPKPKVTDIHVGGTTASFPNNAIAETDEDPIYQTCRYNLDAYVLELPNGFYSVTLKFCEPHYQASGKRVFGVALQGTTVIQELDVFAKAGQNKAMDFTFDSIEVKEKKLKIDFLKHTEFPFISGIVAKGEVCKKINCGGGAHKDFQADLPPINSLVSNPDKPRDLDCGDFYLDWAVSQFGPEVGDQIARIFIEYDGGGAPGKPELVNLPRPSDWKGGPGGVVINKAPWDEVKSRYAFVDGLASLRERVKGKGNLERFDYWLNNFFYLRKLGEMGCARGQLDRVIKTDKEEALKIRLRLARLWEEVMGLRLAIVSNPGEMGVIANLEQHVRAHNHFLDAHDKELEKHFNKPLPPEAKPSTQYAGPARIIVPTQRSCIKDGESLDLKIVLLSLAPPKDAALYWRPLGLGAFNKVSLNHKGRGVYQALIPVSPVPAMEYYITASFNDGLTLYWPRTAPDLNKTVVRGVGRFLKFR